ncbi:hypothetical protein MVEN_00933400 [Mycena venus]|uniref:Uncharacterized protein n=1 Tax=Mycena venus TaxID=2733690 RepID=A0A8H7D1K2_9AGAR|nr:hypothetical protein MVEN_00933400 [Mycena venus]
MVQLFSLFVAAMATSAVYAAPLDARRNKANQQGGVLAATNTADSKPAATAADAILATDAALAATISAAAAAAATAAAALEAVISSAAAAASVTAAAAQASFIAANPGENLSSAEDTGKEAFLQTKLKLEQDAGDSDALQTEADLQAFNDQFQGFRRS